MHSTYFPLHYVNKQGLMHALSAHAQTYVTQNERNNNTLPYHALDFFLQICIVKVECLAG